MKEDGRKKEKKGRWVLLFVFFIFSVLASVLGVLLLNELTFPFVQKHFIPLALLWGGIVILLYGLSVWFALSDKEIWAKSALSGYLFLTFMLGLCLLLQRTGFFEVINSPKSLQEYLERAGAWMPFLYVLLQFLQVVILPIPSIVSTVAGVALFGAFWTMVYSLIGIMLGSIVAFFIGRRLGNRAVSWLVGEEALKKWQKKLKGKDQLFLTLAFVLPVFPDDVLCFVAGLSTMTIRYFLTVIFISRLIGIAATCYSFDFIPFNTWWGLTIWGILIIGIVVAFIVIYKNIDKIQRFFKKKRKNMNDKINRL